MVCCCSLTFMPNFGFLHTGHEFCLRILLFFFFTSYPLSPRKSKELSAALKSKDEEGDLPQKNVFLQKLFLRIFFFCALKSFPDGVVVKRGKVWVAVVRRGIFYLFFFFPQAFKTKKKSLHVLFALLLPTSNTICTIKKPKRIYPLQVRDHLHSFRTRDNPCVVKGVRCGWLL